MIFRTGILSILSLSFFAISCKHTGMDASVTKSDDQAATADGLPEGTYQKWLDYKSHLAAELFPGRAAGLSQMAENDLDAQLAQKLQKDCSPIYLPARVRPAKGMVVIYHGYSGCPNQFINAGRILAEQKGFHVFLPLLPGNGRRPQINMSDEQLAAVRAAIAEADATGQAPSQTNVTKNNVVDDTSGMPLTDSRAYAELADAMASLARAYPSGGVRVVAGLSMGGGETMATILAGNDAATGRNVWDRAMFMSPFFRAPNIQGWAARVVGASLPEFDAGWGESCKINQLRAENDRNRRAGTCDFDAGNIRILDQYSSQAAARAGEVAIPIQIMAVDNDGSADDDATIRMFNQLATPADRKGLCFFCEGVQHAMLYDGDFYPENRDNRWWAPTAQDNLVNFIVDGSPVPLDPEGISQEKGENVCYLPAELRTRCKKYLRK